MASKSSTSSEGSSLPQRHRPAIGNLARDTTEEDLWDIDGEVAAVVPQPRGGKGLPADPGVSVAEEPEELPAVERLIADEPPAPEELPEEQPEAPEEQAEPEQRLMPAPRSGRSDHVRRNLPGRQTPRKDSRAGTGGDGGSLGEMGDLNLWEDLAEDAPIERPPEPQVLRTGAADPVPESVPMPEQPPVKSDAPASGTAVKKAEEDNDFEEEFSTVARTDKAPISLVPRLGLTRLEKIGLIGFAVLMLGGGIFVFMHSINRLPSDDAKVAEQAYPVQGATVSVESAATYWREPTAAEIVRRETVLIPAVELKVGGGPGAIRVFFNDGSGQRVGDPINRAVEGAALLKFAATAGFENFSMHPAYRAGESKPWTIEVFEGPSVNATGDSFKKLLEISVSADRR